ncbi:MAG: hypothetical protein ABFD08_20560 [Syntrophomonas sp.]
MSSIIEVSAQLNRAELLPDEEHMAYLALKIQGTSSHTFSLRGGV